MRLSSPLMLAAALSSTLITALSARAASLSASEAQRHVGEQATVCGMVASARDAEQLRGEPIFLRLGRAYPDQDFSIVILGAARDTLAAPASLIGQQVCVSGRIERFMGKPQVILTSRSQLTE